ncbi:hypothetical protein SERLA73DRAFT_149358 [Serpula lacrymans var. lacrymans S7.3]|uniref:Uncharacterized protein n=1 Tax=Serpula lacrymans var. lacrymans (strain S7.3) TaxID=936435 RepID=F8PI70_SERL3|nr:hypothetical protein SERLA73DRAFT_149358 [Serpula lacrymans var. lacrymans S7.3]
MITPNECSAIQASTRPAQLPVQKSLAPPSFLSIASDIGSKRYNIGFIEVNSSISNLKGIISCNFSSFSSGIDLLDTMDLSPDFSPGLLSPPVLKFIERIERADLHSSNFDEVNHAWKMARGPISKGKASSDLSLSSTLHGTASIISSITSASMAPPLSVSTVSALTVLALVAASAPPVSQITVGDSDSPNEEEHCVEFQTLKKDELIEWIKTSGVTISNLK